MGNIGCNAIENGERIAVRTTRIETRCGREQEAFRGSFRSTGWCPRGKDFGDVICSFSRSTQHVCLPKTDHRPACGFECAHVFAIARHVSPHLGDPVGRIVSSGEPCKAAFQIASMPEVAVAEDHEASRREDDIRPSRQSQNMEAIAESTTPKLTPQGKLASRVRLRAGASCRRGRTHRGRMQSRERGRASHALARLHRGRILPMTATSLTALINRPTAAAPPASHAASARGPRRITTEARRRQHRIDDPQTRAVREAAQKPRPRPIPSTSLTGQVWWREIPPHD